MDWSPQQETALRRVSAWRQGRKQVFYLAGVAGTGKTTLAQHFAECVPGRVLFAAYTGKAAHVLQSKGCAGATTIHKLIYLPREKGRGTLERLESELKIVQAKYRQEPESSALRFRLALDSRALHKRIKEEKERLAQPAFTLNEESPLKGASLLILDECSMIGSQLGYDLLSFGVKLLVLGDPAQLPPVKDGGFFTRHTPDYMLTEIHRQAKDNPIIALSCKVRGGGTLPLGTWGDSKVILPKQLDPQEVLDADQLLVGLNKTRTDANRRIRNRLYWEGVEWLPQTKDKLVCLRNDHNTGLLNGSLWEVCACNNYGEGLGLGLTITNDDEDSLSVLAHPDYFRDGKMEPIPWFMRKEAQEFDYGYALTVHKAQGSQWNHVVVLDESHSFRNAKRKWLYTAITRAAKRVTIVEM